MYSAQMSSDSGPIRKLSALMGMLGSDYDGERANAARLATLELRRLGLTWADVVKRAFHAIRPEPAPAPSYKPEPRYEPPPAEDWWQENWQYSPSAKGKRPAGQRTKKYTMPGGQVLDLWDLCSYAITKPERINAWEAGFCQSFVKIGPKATATGAQWRCLVQIALKLNLG